MHQEDLYIDGEYVKSNADKWIEVENPATEEIIGRVPRSTQEDVDRAVAAAKAAFPTWSKLTVDERAEYVERFYTWLEEHKDEMVNIQIDELGIPVKQAENAHYQLQLDRIQNFIKQAKEFEHTHQVAEETYVRREPIGVVGCLTPWNYPLGQIIQKVIPGLLAGCTIVLKPSQKTPLTGCLMVRGFHEIGLPNGVLNLVTGTGSEVGNMISAHPDVDKVSFTGSTDAGIQVAQTALETVKKITLELGGKSPAIFIEGADVEQGVKTVLGSILNNTGQTCSALSRVVVLASEKDKVVDEILCQVATYKVGDPRGEGTNIGSLASKDQYDKVQDYIHRGIDQGAKMIFGEVPEKGPEDTGYFVQPVVFDNVTTDMDIHKEEIFGPVLSIETVESVEEAIEVANDVKYGLNSAVFGENERAHEIAKEIKAGTVIVNDAKGSPNQPFGGYKQSGIGRESGVYGYEEYLEIKSIQYKK